MTKKAVDKKASKPVVSSSKSKYEGNYKRNGKKLASQESVNSYYYLIPIIIVLTLVPLIVKLVEYKPNLSQFNWYPNVEKEVDLFLYYKQWTFIITSTVAALILIFKFLTNRKSLRFYNILIPLIAYAACILLSTIFSENILFSILGSYEQFESAFVLLGYCILVYYIISHVNNESDFKLLYKYILIGIVIIVCLGVLQYFGKDFFASEPGKRLIVPFELREKYNTFMRMEKGRVYATLYNPNYMGLYAAMMLPFVFIMLMFEKKIINIILALVVFVGLIICLYGSKSLTGIISLCVAALSIVIFMWRMFIKRYYISIPIIIIILSSILYFFASSNNNFIQKLKNNLTNSKTNFTIEAMYTTDDYVSFIYKGNEIRIKCTIDNNGILVLSSYDKNNNELEMDYDQVKSKYIIKDDRFDGIVIGWEMERPGAFYVSLANYKFSFTNLTGDNSYYIINAYGKLDKAINPPSAVFTNYEKLASGRGYIWSRTIPLLKKNLIWGSGPDTFVIAFPQQDYLGAYRNGYVNQIITKPHNLYLQIGVQTGVLSLIAFLVFYLMYFIDSVKLYIRGIFNSYYAKIGIAVFVSTISYMFAGLTNDSSICTAPVFWCLLGIGIAANMKAKPIILEELAIRKAAKAVDTADKSVE